MNILNKQTVFDVCIENFGSLDYICNIIRANNIGITYDISGMNLIVNAKGIGNEVDKKYLKQFRCNNNYNESGLYLISDEGVYIITDENKNILT